MWGAMRPLGLMEDVRRRAVPRKNNNIYEQIQCRSILSLEITVFEKNLKKVTYTVFGEIIPQPRELHKWETCIILFYPESITLNNFLGVKIKINYDLFIFIKVLKFLRLLLFSDVIHVLWGTTHFFFWHECIKNIFLNYIINLNFLVLKN